MRGTLTLALEQLRARRRSGLLLLFAVAALASTAMVAGASVMGNAGDRVDQLYQDSGRPDVYYATDSFDDFETTLRAQPEVADVGRAFLTSSATVAEAGGEGVPTRLSAIDDPTEAIIGAPILRTGRWAESVDEVVIDAAWAVDHGVGIGDVIELELGGEVTLLDTVGTALDLGDCFYPNCDPIPAWVTTDSFTSLAPESTYVRGFATLIPGVDDETFAGRILTSRPSAGMGTWSDTRADMVVSAEISSYFVSGLGVFVMIASALVVASTAVTVIITRRREIALLKAMGATPAQVTGSIIIEHLVVAMPGVLVGWVLGSMLAPGLEVGLAGPLGRAPIRPQLALLLFALTVVLGILTVATAMPAMRAGRASTIEALRNPPSQAGERLQRLIDRLPGSVNVSLGSRLVLARPLRVLLAAIALAMAASAVYTTWSLSLAVDRIFAEPASAGDPWDLTITPTDLAETAAVDGVLSANPDVEGWYRERYTRVVVDGEQVTTFAVGDGSREPGHVILEGSRAVHAGEATAAHGFLNEFGYAVGDRVTVTHSDTPIEVDIVGRHADAEDSGRILIIPAETFNEAGLDDSLPMWRVAAADGADRYQLAAELEPLLATDTSVLVLDPDLEAAGFIRVALVLLSATIAIVALGNLAATMASTARERQRRTGVLRSLGFSSRQLLGQSCIAGALVGAVAAVIGVPLGFIASTLLLDAIMGLVGIGSGLATVPVLGPTLVLTVLCIAAGSAIGVGASAPSLQTPTSDLLRAE